MWTKFFFVQVFFHICNKILGMHCCSNQGPGYASPADAIKGPKEKILFVTCANVNPKNNPDALMTVDVDPESQNYCNIIGRILMPNKGDEVHHLGWNACSSCFGNPSAIRKNLVLPCLNSNRIYIVDTSDPTNLKLTKTIEGAELKKFNASVPHTAHCLADGNIMVSTMGDANESNKGNFILINGETFEVTGTWPSLDSQPQKFAYDFWYQPRLNVMVATEWGVPTKICHGFKLEDVAAGYYGNHVHIYDWKERKLIQSIELEGFQGWTPLEVRFLHEPTSPHCFYGTALGSTLYHLYRNKSGKWINRIAASIPVKKVSGWGLDEMPALITDILISMDDKYLYASCFLFGEILQYDIQDPFNVKLAGKIKIGGSLHTESGVKLLNEHEQQKPLYVKGVRIEGGPQMLQLSLDGKRLYVTNSLYSIWDNQFYPDMIKKGSQMIQLDVDTKNGGMKVNESFLVDFGHLPNGPFLAHEMRYPGGDCSSDIWGAESPKAESRSANIN